MDVNTENILYMEDKDKSLWTIKRLKVGADNLFYYDNGLLKNTVHEKDILDHLPKTVYVAICKHWDLKVGESRNPKMRRDKG